MKFAPRSITFSFLLAVCLCMATAGFALASSGTIDSTNKYAWSNQIGWINFAPANGNVIVTDTAITGYAWSENFGWINFNPSGGGITNTTGGILSGSAWGENTGWIDFSGVSINTSTGRFSGFATGDVVGTLSFDCTNCNVTTTWRPASSSHGGGGGVLALLFPPSPPALVTHSECSAQQQCVSVDGAGGDQCQTSGDCTITHSTCQNQQCISIAGAGLNSCSANADCAVSHAECNASHQCVVVAGLGSNQCQTDANCVAPSHSVCQAQQCIFVQGAGSNQCATNADCVITHQECQNEQCISVNGVGINQCTAGKDCALPRHNTCQNNQCVVIPGAGANLCQTNGDCNVFHNECRAGSCTALPGVGINQCSISSDCQQPVHNECQNNQCVTVQGSGVGQCQTSDDCTAPKHNACQNQQCVLVNGAGSNQCQVDSNCKPDIVSTIKDIPTSVEKVVTQPSVVATTKVVSTLGATVGVVATSFAVAFSPASLLNLLDSPFRLFNFMLVGFGFKRRKTQWGIVYDSATKQPLDPAYVRLLAPGGQEVASAVTDLDGRYGFFVPAGSYTMLVQKTNYRFPSQTLAGKQADEVYQNLYFGEPFALEKNDGIITKNIPLDPVAFDWNEFAKKNQRMMIFYSTWDPILKKAYNIFFRFGLLVAVVLFLFAPKPFNTIVMMVYLVVVLLRILGLKPKPFGFIIDRASHVPLPFAIVRVMLPDVNIEVSHKVTDKFGRYYCLVPPGRFYVKIEKKNPDGSYATAYTSPVINFAKKGIINRKFVV